VFLRVTKIMLLRTTMMRTCVHFFAEERLATMAGTEPEQLHLPPAESTVASAIAFHIFQHLRRRNRLHAKHSAGPLPCDDVHVDDVVGRAVSAAFDVYLPHHIPCPPRSGAAVASGTRDSVPKTKTPPKIADGGSSSSGSSSSVLHTMAAAASMRGWRVTPCGMCSLRIDCNGGSALVKWAQSALHVMTNEAATWQTFATCDEVLQWLEQQQHGAQGKPMAGECRA
jgi:hypothetical protein